MIGRFGEVLLYTKCINIHCINIYILHQTSIIRPTMEPILNGTCREVVGLRSYNGRAWASICGPNKAINIGEWSICGGEVLLYVYICVCVYIYIYIYVYVCMYMCTHLNSSFVKR